MMKFQNVEGMLKEVDPNEIVLVALSDRLGRGNLGEKDIKQTKEDVNKFKEIISKSQKH